MPEAPPFPAAIQAIYDELPTVECQGLCWNSCGPISMSRVERARIEERGVHIEPFDLERSHAWRTGAPLHCAALDQFKRCTVHDVRPLICRVWGVGRGEMACTHGCTVTGGRLKHADVMHLLNKVMLLGGGPDYLEAEDADPEEWVLNAEALDDPEVARLVSSYVEGNYQVEAEMTAAMKRALARIRERNAQQ